MQYPGGGGGGTSFRIDKVILQRILFVAGYVMTQSMVSALTPNSSLVL